MNAFLLTHCERRVREDSCLYVQSTAGDIYAVSWWNLFLERWV